MSNGLKFPKCNNVFKDELECLRCNHKWKPRNDSIHTVSLNIRCKFPYWNKKEELLKNLLLIKR